MKSLSSSHSGVHDLIEISVTDTGSGMTKESMKSLGRLTFENKLAGFGLTTSNYIAEKLAPKPISGLYVESEKGFGSTFTFYLENIRSDSIQEEEIELQVPEKKKLAKINMSIIDSKYSSNGDDEEENYEDDSASSPDFQDSNLKVLSDQLNDEYMNFDFKNKFSSKKEISNFNINTASTPPDIGSSPFSAQFFDRTNQGKGSSYSIILKKIDEVSNSRPDMPTKISTFGSRMQSTLKTFNSQQSNELQCKKLSIIDKFKKRLLKKTCNCPDILIVDDNLYNILALEKMIETFTLKVHTATSGEIALQKIKTFYEDSPCPKELKCLFYKCVLMDIDMPIMDGHETAKGIAEYFREKNFTQVIIPCTAFNDEVTIQKCKEVGMVDFLAKPVSLETLEHVLYKNMFSLCE